MAALINRTESGANLPMDYPVEDFELEGIDLKTLVAPALPQAQCH